MNTIKLTGDMGEDTRLQLLTEDDGDIVVSVIPAGARAAPHGHSVQFCTPGTGGGKNPHTHRALRDLKRAMEKDQKGLPFSPPPAIGFIEIELLRQLLQLAEATARTASNLDQLIVQQAADLVNRLEKAAAPQD